MRHIGIVILGLLVSGASWAADQHRFFSECSYQKLDMTGCVKRFACEPEYETPRSTALAWERACEVLDQCPRVLPQLVKKAQAGIPKTVQRPSGSEVNLIHLAAQKCQAEAVSDLRQEGFSLFDRDEEGRSFFWYWTQSRCRDHELISEFVELFIENHALKPQDLVPIAMADIGEGMWNRVLKLNLAPAREILWGVWKTVQYRSRYGSQWGLVFENLWSNLRRLFSQGVDLFAPVPSPERILSLGAPVREDFANAPYAPQATLFRELVESCVGISQENYRAWDYRDEFHCGALTALLSQSEAASPSKKGGRPLQVSDLEMFGDGGGPIGRREVTYPNDLFVWFAGRLLDPSWNGVKNCPGDSCVTAEVLQQLVWIAIGRNESDVALRALNRIIKRDQLGASDRGARQRALSEILDRAIQVEAVEIAEIVIPKVALTDQQRMTAKNTWTSRLSAESGQVYCLIEKRSKDCRQ